MLAQVQSAAKHARDRVITKNASKMGFLRQNKDGTTSMKILVATDNDLPERVVSLGAFTGKLQQGTGQLQVNIFFVLLINMFGLTKLFLLCVVIGFSRRSTKHSQNRQAN